MSDRELDREVQREIRKTIAGSSLPVRCPVHNKTYHYSGKGFPKIHEQYFCEHIWWCNICTSWCSPDRYCHNALGGHEKSVPAWGIIIDRNQRYYMLVLENNRLRELVRDFVQLCMTVGNASVADETQYDTWWEQNNKLLQRTKEILGSDEEVH